MNENDDIIPTTVLALSECQRERDAFPFRRTSLFYDFALIEQGVEFTMRGCAFEHVPNLPEHCIAESWDRHFQCSRFAKASSTISFAFSLIRNS